MIQTLQFFMLESGMEEGVDVPRFEAIALDRPMTWKYRGQVVPLNDKVQVTLDVTEVGRDAAGPFAIASASLWCDGIRIYSADGMGMRIVSGNPPSNGRRSSNEPDGKSIGEQSTALESRAKARAASSAAGIVLDPTVDLWLADHCPTWNRPALPMMCIADQLAGAVPGNVVALRDVQVNGWVDFDGPRRLWTELEERSPDSYFVRLYADLGDPTDSGSGAGMPHDGDETRAVNAYVNWIIKT